jgi:hypothetical protein
MFETVNRIYRNWGIGAFALPVLVVIALTGLALTHSERSSWMSEAVRAEFTSFDSGPEAMPKQLAQPVDAIRAGLKHTASQR